MKRFLFALVAYVLFTVSVQAATCYWVGGSGNFDNTNTASWASATGGVSGSCAATGGIPKNAADFAIFDANSGSPTITVCGASSANCPSGSGSVNIAGITFGACTCVMDFGTNNPNVTLSTTFSGTGTATRSLDMGTGTWTYGGTSGSWTFITTTGFTPTDITSASIVWTNGSTGSNFFGGGLTWGPLTITGNASYPGSVFLIENGNNGANTFASLTINAPAYILFRAGVTQTFTSGITINGSSASNLVSFTTDNSAGASYATLSLGAASSVSWAVFRQITASTNNLTATNSFSLSGAGPFGTLSITNPSTGGGGKIIGG